MATNLTDAVARGQRLRDDLLAANLESCSSDALAIDTLLAVSVSAAGYIAAMDTINGMGAVPRRVFKDAVTRSERAYRSLCAAVGADTRTGDASYG